MKRGWRFGGLLTGWLVLVASIVGLLVYPWDRSGLAEYRGTLRYPVCQIGGETTGVVLVTANGAYELDVRADPQWQMQLRSLAGKRVIVVGKLWVGRGIEVAERRIIRVHDLKVDPSAAPMPPVPRGRPHAVARA